MNTRLKPLDNIDRGYKYDKPIPRSSCVSTDRIVRESDKFKISELPTSAELQEIDKINRQMAAVGLVVIPIVFILAIACVVAQVGMKFGWW